MKLSVSKRFGWIQVRGGRVLRVAKPHTVKTSGRSEFADSPGDNLSGEKDPPRWEGETPKWVYAEEGDLAVEIIAVKTDKILGHSYLSGPAIQLNGYEPFDQTWFGEAVNVELVEIPDPQGEEWAAFVEKAVGLLMKIKYSETVGVGAFHYKCREGEDPRDVAQGLAQMWSYVDDSREPTAHLLGAVEGFGKSKKKSWVTLHFQPPKHASDFAATSFQTELVLSVVRGPA